MKRLQHYFETNKNLWNNKTPIHVDSEFYNMQAFKEGESSLRKIELAELPDLNGKKLLHTQCHFGQDTLSLERLGAQCTGVDFSDVAIDQANNLRDELGLKSQFVCCNIYDLDKHVEDLFDFVFASYGVITWLPDLNLWAKQISQRLKPGGAFYFIEFHPLLYMFDWDSSKLQYDYFYKEEPETEVEEGTYADKNAQIAQKEYFWMHSLSEIMTSLSSHDLLIESFKEYDYSPYNVFGDEESTEKQCFRYKPNGVSIPHVFLMKAIKK